MSTICLAAQRSFQTGEAVWFSYRLPSLNTMLVRTLASLCCLFALLAAGLYAHIYWNLRHPAPAPKPVSVAQPDTQLSDMHYVYVSKPFPTPKVSHPEYSAPLPPPGDPWMMDSEPDWQQAPDSDSSASPLSDSHDVPPETGSLSLKERLMEALKEQQQDYSRGKIPQDPVDETQASALNGESVINQTAAFKSEKISMQEIKKSPSALTHGDSEKDVQ